jgi:hypothetical protein
MCGLIYYLLPFFIHVGLDEEPPASPPHMWDDGKQPPKNLVGVSRAWMGLPCNTCPAKFKCPLFFLMFGAWLDGPLRWRANNGFKGTHHIMHY